MPLTISKPASRLTKNGVSFFSFNLNEYGILFPKINKEIINGNVPNPNENITNIA